MLNAHYRSEFHALAGAGRGGGTTTATASTATGGTRADDDGVSVLPDDRGRAGYQPHHGERAGLGNNRQTHAVNKSSPPAESSSQPRARNPLGEGRGQPVTQLREKRQRRSRGGFRIEYNNNGREAPRAAYYATALMIEINLDHPLLAAVTGDHNLFQGLAFTIAAEEYAQATANDLLTEKILEDAFDALQYIRSTMDRLSRAFADAEVFSILTAPPEPRAAAR